jgi:hypothetical protein
VPETRPLWTHKEQHRAWLAGDPPVKREKLSIFFSREQGVFAAALRNINNDNELRRKHSSRNDLAFADLGPGFHLFAAVFGFFSSNDTRNVTRE